MCRRVRKDCSTTAHRAIPLPRRKPGSACLQVRVLRDYGEVVFSSGRVALERGKSHWLPRDEAHPLLMDGVLECVRAAGDA